MISMFVTRVYCCWSTV